MAGTCREGSCETESACDSSSSECCKACQSACGGDPVACATALWSSSFFQALKAVQVDLLKEKIRKAWGSKMDKAAEAVLESMGVHWQSMLAQAKAKQELGEKLQGLWQEGQK